MKSTTPAANAHLPQRRRPGGTRSPAGARERIRRALAWFDEETRDYVARLATLRR